MTTSSERYWNRNNDKYPYQVTVPYMSPQDPKPRDVQLAINFHFLRVPFDGQAHWGFLTLRDLENFKSRYNIQETK